MASLYLSVSFTAVFFSGPDHLPSRVGIMQEVLFCSLLGQQNIHTPPHLFPQLPPTTHPPKPTTHHLPASVHLCQSACYFPPFTAHIHHPTATIHLPPNILYPLLLFPESPSGPTSTSDLNSNDAISQSIS